MNSEPGDGAAREEFTRLRAENDALNEQVKLLVVTEQRLHRSQNELDAQLALVRALTQFALESSTLEEPEATLARALRVLDSSFAIDWAGFVHPGPEPGTVRVPAALTGADGDDDGSAPRAVDTDLATWLRSVPAAGWSRLDPGAPEPCWCLLRAVAPGLGAGSEWKQGAEMAFVPVRGAGTNAPGVLLVASLHARPAFVHGGALGAQHLPYLSLLENHVDHALSNAHLTRSLRERGEELAQSVSRLESTQQELLQAQKMEAIGRLAGGVAHDFNNLLTVILGYAGTLAMSLPAGSQAQDNLDKITAAAQRAANLTRQLLALGRRQVQRREHLALSEQCEHTVELLRRLVGENIRIELRLDRSPTRVFADRSQLEQVLLNLMINARDAMPSGGVLRITTRPANAADAASCETHVAPGRFQVLEVEDDGIGMDARTLERIFEPFFTTKPSGQGTGLGLAVVYGIVKQSEGHVLVDSQAGRGSRFRVLLPIESPPVAAEPAAPEAAGDAPAPAGTTILVVEDEAAIRGVVRATLRRAGYVVLEATDGEDALARMSSRLPDLVLTDILMPRMGGSALARELAVRHPRVRVAFMSGYAADFGEDDSTAALLARFLPKPFSGDELRAFVARQLGVASPAGL